MENKFMEACYKPLKAYMGENSITQTKLAKMTGISNNSISLMLKGNTKGSIESLEKIANALKLPVEKIIRME